MVWETVGDVASTTSEPFVRGIEETKSYLYDETGAKDVVDDAYYESSSETWSDSLYSIGEIKKMSVQEMATYFKHLESDNRYEGKKSLRKKHRKVFKQKYKARMFGSRKTGEEDPDYEPIVPKMTRHINEMSKTAKHNKKNQEESGWLWF